MNEKPYRLSVGIMIVNACGQVFMGQRAFPKRSLYRWQMPQGGIDQGETPEQAVWRELYEETGLTDKDVKMVAISEHWYQYDLPPKASNTIRGNRQKWFLFSLVGKDHAVSLDKNIREEFSGFRWFDLKDVISLTIPFRREVYRQVVDEFASVVDCLKTS